MTSEGINEVINNLCDKLGTTVSQLLPEIAKMKTAECMTTIIICFVVLCCGIFFTIKRYKACSEVDVFDSGWVLLIIGIIIVMMFFACTMIVNIIDLAGWFSSPTAKALLFIMESVK